jgi:acyl-CoA synthetase (AMP-forming)/AMP-acid ligase II
LIELIERAARLDDNRPAIIVNDREVSYPQLLHAATSVAATLRAREVRRFAVADFDAITVLALLAGASAAGAEACVYPPDDDPGAAAELMQRFDHDTVVSSRTDLAAGPTVLTPDELLHADDGGRAPDVPAERPLLILTTGTTGAPKGVRHDWTRLLRPFRHVAPATGQRWLLAYGLHQFGGLQLVLQTLAAGATLVAPVPRRPKSGLAALRAHGVTHASATPTYWRFLLAELAAGDEPAPALEQVTLGGEAVPASLLAELRRVFPTARISQIYAANESGSVRSVRDERNGLPLSVLDDDPDADVALKIVGDELWVRSRIGMLGYYGDDPVDPDEWRPTGDLVEVVDGRVYFRGRRSEIINVGGTKVHPLPIEERISAVAGVRVVRVYGRRNALTGAIVAAEVVADERADRDQLADRIRAACADLPDAARPRSIRFVDAIETTGDKLARSQRQEAS